jgi:hypothetical protein
MMSFRVDAEREGYILAAGRRGKRQGNQRVF